MDTTSISTPRVSHKLLNHLAVALVLTGLITGCGKKQSPAHGPAAPSASGAPAMSSNANSAEQPADAAPSATSAQPLEGTIHEFMTAQLKIFIQEKGRMPADFAELARTKLDSVPRAPPGSYWAIDPVTQEVKLMKQK